MAKLRPQPVVKSQTCSVCDLDWSRHPENPTVEDCIQLLKVEAYRPTTYPYQITWTTDGSGAGYVYDWQMVSRSLKAVS